MPLKKIRSFFELEAAAGILLGISAILAILIANSPLSFWYVSWISSEHIVQIGGFKHSASLADWVKDGLMAIFFFHVGLEIKKEVMVGELSDPKKLALPVFGALGGMIAPALVFLFVAKAGGANDIMHAWPIPVATDIAFAVAAISIVASRLPPSLKIFLLTLAVVDDLGAIVLIAALYSHEVDYQSLSISLGIFLALLASNFLGLRRPWIYVAGGIFIWVFMLQSGFHPTLAGVLAALAVPLKPSKGQDISPLEDLHDDFSDWVKYLIMPLFAFTHAGIDFASLSIENLNSPLVYAIVLGLLLGKPIGVSVAVYLASILKIATIPHSVKFKQIVGIGFLCGIGFTMSLFLGGLAFNNSDGDLLNEARIGVFIGSILSALFGIYLLRSKTQIKAKIE